MGYTVSYDVMDEVEVLGDGDLRAEATVLIGQEVSKWATKALEHDPRSLYLPRGILDGTFSMVGEVLHRKALKFHFQAYNFTRRVRFVNVLWDS